MVNSWMAAAIVIIDEVWVSYSSNNIMTMTTQEFVTTLSMMIALRTESRLRAHGGLLMYIMIVG